MDLKVFLKKAETLIEAAAAPTGGGAGQANGIEAAHQRLTACMMAAKAGGMQPAEVAHELKAIANDLNMAASSMPQGAAPQGQQPGQPPPAPPKKPPQPPSPPGSSGPPGTPAAGYKSIAQKFIDAIDLLKEGKTVIAYLQKQLDPIVELKVTLSALRDTCWDLSDALSTNKIDVAKTKIKDITRLGGAAMKLLEDKADDTEKAAPVKTIKRSLTKKALTIYVAKQLSRAAKQAEKDRVAAAKRIAALHALVAVAKAASWEDDNATSVDFDIEEAYVDTADGGKEMDLTSIEDQEEEETKITNGLEGAPDGSIAVNFEEVVKTTNELFSALTEQKAGDTVYAAGGGQPGGSPLAKSAPGEFDWPLDMAQEQERPDDFDAKKDPWTQLRKRDNDADDLHFGKDPKGL